MAQSDPDLVVLFEHPEWQKPLFEVLEQRGVPYRAWDLKKAAFSDRDPPPGRLVFNQASPSAYVRGNVRAVPYALNLIEDLEARGIRVINGSRAFRLELSKTAQIGLLRRLGVDHPRTWVFNDVSALRPRRDELPFPAVLKPNQGGSGARMFRLESFEELEELLESRPEIWLPDNLLLLQEYLPHDMGDRGIVRLEFVGGDLLYAMRVISRGNFNLCPSEVCNPVGGDATGEDVCGLPEATEGGDSRPDFLPYLEVPSDAVGRGRRVFLAAGLDVGSVEYLETPDGRLVFYDINANSNLRRPIGAAFGLDPFERVVDFLVRQLRRQSVPAAAGWGESPGAPVAPAR
jgi:hypothetical protein